MDGVIELSAVNVEVLSIACEEERCTKAVSELGVLDTINDDKSLVVT
jgi:hypothetical protein